MQHDRAASMPSAGTQRFPIQPRLGSELMTDDAVAQQVHPEQEFKGGDGYHGGRDPGSSGSSTSRQDSGKISGSSFSFISIAFVCFGMKGKEKEDVSFEVEQEKRRTRVETLHTHPTKMQI